MDEALVRQAQAGDQEALVTLLTARNEKLYRTAYLYLHNQADALDAVQETALQAMLNIKRLRHPEYFDTWLVRIAINVACKMMRKPPQPQPARASDEPSAAADLRQDLATDLAQLPKRYQEVVVMYYYNDLPLKQIAATLHQPLGTVKSRLHRGLALLRQKGAVIHEEYGL